MTSSSFDPRRHELVLGVPGSGKTHLTRRLTAAVRRCIFFDPTADGYTKCGEEVRAQDLSPELLAGKFARLVVVPGLEVADDFRATLDACRAAGRSAPLLLVADEVGDYSASCAAELTRLHRNGHHDGVGSILVSQTAVDIPKTCRRTATRVHSLLQTHSDDLAALAAEYGDDFAAKVAAWRPRDRPVSWSLPTLYRAKEVES